MQRGNMVQDGLEHKYHHTLDDVLKQEDDDRGESGKESQGDSLSVGQ